MATPLTISASHNNNKVIMGQITVGPYRPLLARVQIPTAAAGLCDKYTEERGR